MRRFSPIALAGIGLAVCLATSACTGVSNELSCAQSDECVRGGAQGQCMPPGFCAFSDGDCASGFRWDATASTELAGLCVGDEGLPDAGPGAPDGGGGRNACGGTGQLAGAPGASCGICDSGTYQCDGQEAVRCNGELTLDTPITNLGTVQAETTFDGSFQASLAVDGNLTTSWFSDGPDSDGSPTFFRWDRGADVCITRITYTGNGAHSNESFRAGFGFGEVTIRVLDAGGQPVFSQVHNLDPNPAVPDPNLEIPTGGVMGQTVELLLLGHESVNNDCGGFAELTVTSKQ